MPFNKDPRRVQAGDMPAAMPAATELIFRHFVSQCLYTFTAIGAADAIGGEELTATAIAAKLAMPVNVGYLARILRLLACEGVVTEKKRGGEDGTNVGFYGLTDVGKLFQANIPQQPDLAEIGNFLLHPITWVAWHSLYEATVAPRPPAGTDDVATADGSTGTPVPFQMAHGAPFYDFVQAHPEYKKRFFESMALTTELEMPVVLAHDWSTLNGKTVMDVGGGMGTVMESVANAYPGIARLISLDTQDVISMAPKPSNPKVELVAGDFFDASTLPKCDAIFMKHILHNWSDTDCKKILSACHKALSVGDQLIVAEEIISDIGDTSPQTLPAKNMDIMMMVLCGSHERSPEEWTTLLCGEGLFKMGTITKSPSSFSIITCTKV